MIKWDSPKLCLMAGKGNSQFEALWEKLDFDFDVDLLDAARTKPTHIKIEVEGRFWMGNNQLPEFDADGSRISIVPAEALILKNCRFAGVIGKFDGSSASHKASTNEGSATDVAIDEPFTIGRFCIVKIPAAACGPLFLGFNTMLRPVMIREGTVIEASFGYQQNISGTETGMTRDGDAATETDKSEKSASEASRST